MRINPWPFLLVLASATAVAAQVNGQVSGPFSSQGVRFNVAGGVAFTHQSNLDCQTPVLLVAVSNTGMNVGAIANSIDRKRAIDQLFKDEETPVVYRVHAGRQVARR